MTDDVAQTEAPMTWSVTGWGCGCHPGYTWHGLADNWTAQHWISGMVLCDGPEPVAYLSLDALRAEHSNLTPIEVDNVRALIADESRYRQLWHATVRERAAQPRDAAKDAAEAAWWRDLRVIVDMEREKARADTLAEVDAILHDGRRFDLWTAAVPHPGRPGYVFADERRYLAAYLASEMGGAVPAPADEPAACDGDVVADLRHGREQP